MEEIFVSLYLYKMIINKNQKKENVEDEECFNYGDWKSRKDYIK